MCTVHFAANHLRNQVKANILGELIRSSVALCRLADAGAGALCAFIKLILQHCRWQQNHNRYNSHWYSNAVIVRQIATDVPATLSVFICICSGFVASFSCRYYTAALRLILAQRTFACALNTVAVTDKANTSKTLSFACLRQPHSSLPAHRSALRSSGTLIKN